VDKKDRVTGIAYREKRTGPVKKTGQKMRHRLSGRISRQKVRLAYSTLGAKKSHLGSLII
jgi:hypothetical protein